MKPLKLILLLVFFSIHMAHCQQKPVESPQISSSPILPGADQPEIYLPLLTGKKVGLVVNQTSILTQQDNLHLVDYLMKEGVKVQKVFVPEHGFRGDADAGEVIKNDTDKRTGLPVISLYGDNKKPTATSLADVDLIIYDLQDVGVRFYTYISTLHYVMEACAEIGKPILLLDRPNPNGDYIDGPVLDPKFTSFVGMHPIPVVHGLTVAELAQMINGEGWLKNKVKADVQIIKIQNWDHGMPYSLPVKPSPNLPNDLSIRLYPSLCYFEGTDVSLGRGTYYPFQVYGYPDPKFGSFSFTPVSIQGMSKNPPQMDKKCYGEDLRNEPLDHQFTLKYLLKAYELSGKKEAFFNNFFDKLAGTDQLRKDILSGKTESEIQAKWKPSLEAYKQMRAKYVLY
ncbi:exo-beta-N-acetylmuramidase NamZ family protein [Pararhodonellum marinum]|uniref:exo-beta-N-acetylmuramidase NamZ family protein n=1 Tax=Pararhodonellum marinum TaxID=2755358 RepID=UPI00188E9ED9